MDVIRARDCRVMPWKNGGGSTTEVATGPAGASLDAFDWRVSMADVATDGPFSHFAGIDRTLAVIRGSGLLLSIGDEAPVTVTIESEPIAFEGDAPTSARLVAGEITDLNVMTRRGRYSSQMTRLRRPVACDFGGNDIAVLVSLNGDTTIVSDRDRQILGDGDAAVLTKASENSFNIRPAPASICYLIWLREHVAA
jgi:environmental stress-induced protein Ves